jgi:hypothetical protein
MFPPTNKSHPTCNSNEGKGIFASESGRQESFFSCCFPEKNNLSRDAHEDDDRCIFFSFAFGSLLLKRQEREDAIAIVQLLLPELNSHHDESTHAHIFHGIVCLCV